MMPLYYHAPSLGWFQVEWLMRVFSLLSSLLATEALPGSQSARRSNVIIAPPLEWTSRSDGRDAAGAMRRCEICVSEETASTGIGWLEAAGRRMITQLHVAKQFIGGTGCDDYLVEHLWRDLRVLAIVEGAAQVIRKIMDRDWHHQ